MKIKTKELLKVLKNFKAIAKKEFALMSIKDNSFILRTSDGLFVQTVTKSLDKEICLSASSTEKLFKQLSAFSGADTEVTEHAIGFLKIETVAPTAPTVYDLSNIQEFEFDLNEVKVGLEKTYRSVSTDTGRQYLSNVCFCDGNLVSTDGRRLSIFATSFATSLDDSCGNHSFLIPVIVAKSILNFAEGNTIKLSFAPHAIKNYNQIKVKTDNLDYSIDIANYSNYCEFPNYKRVIPDESRLLKTTFNRRLALKMLTTANSLVDKKTKKIIIENGCIHVDTSDNFWSSDVIFDKRILIAVNVAYLLDVCKQYSADVLELFFKENSSLNAIVIKENETAKTIVMPMTL